MLHEPFALFSSARLSVVPSFGMLSRWTTWLRTNCHLCSTYTRMVCLMELGVSSYLNNFCTPVNELDIKSFQIRDMEFRIVSQLKGFCKASAVLSSVMSSSFAHVSSCDTWRLFTFYVAGLAFLFCLSFVLFRLLHESAPSSDVPAQNSSIFV